MVRKNSAEMHLYIFLFSQVEISPVFEVKKINVTDEVDRNCPGIHEDNF